MRRRTVAIAIAIGAAVAGLTVGAVTWPHDGTALVPPTAHFVTTLPLPGPALSTTPSGSSPEGSGHLTLPPQPGLQAGQVYLGWRLLAADAPPGTVTVLWDGTADPELPGCGSRPIAVTIQETPTAVRVGLIGSVPPAAQFCSALGSVAVVDVPLSRPAAERALYRLTS